MPIRKRPYELFWDKYAKLYTTLQEQNKINLYNNVGNYINSYLSNKMSVLELSCGTGQITKRCCFSVKEWTATDFSYKMIEYARRNCMSNNVNFSFADAHSLPFENECFDAVVIANALHIFPEAPTVLSEIKRVMKHDALLIAPTFVYDWNTSIKRHLKPNLMKSFGFQLFSKWTFAEYRDFIEKNGFTVIGQKNIGDEFLTECVLICKKEDHDA